MTTVPQQRSGGQARRPNWALIIAVALVIALTATYVARILLTQPVDPLANAVTAPVALADLTLGVSATGQVEPRVQAELTFTGSAGRVSELLVNEGDTVKAGDPLIALDSRQLAAELAAAEASLAVAQADLQAVSEGATAEQIAEAQAQVQAAQGSLTQTQGSVTAADTRAARAAVDEARARLDVLLAGPKSDERARTQTALTDAAAERDRQRNALAAAKEQARITVEQRANTVREAQAAYSTAFWDLDYVKKNESDPRTGRPLSDAEVQDYVNAFAQAERNLADAEANLNQAQVDYETAKQNEASGLESAEARVRSAQADLDELLSGAEADELAAARAQLARAEADLASLSSAERSGAINAGQANVAAAQARLEQLTSDPLASDYARANARVAQAQAQLEQARIRLEDATLYAPFDGVVAQINVAPGETISGATTPLVLIDVARYLVKVTVDEVDIARVAIGQQVEVLIDALGAPTLSGTVLRSEPLPSGDSGVTSYRVTVEIDPSGRALKPGMTASATIIADRRTNALSLPAAAVRSEGEKSLVKLVVVAADGSRTVEDREVQVGLRTDDTVEIVSGLAEGDQVVMP
jgi:HlyD family secretion protein